jgi:hypothetical protein
MIASLSASDRAELEDFSAEACRLVLRGQFARDAFEKVGFGASEIAQVERTRLEQAQNNDYALFRQVFRREMYTQVVANLKKVGLLTSRMADNLRKIGIDSSIDGRAYSLESQIIA